ncbi:hypothetical protein P879_01168 [Paragonimus westermani]|uniref:Uncharacterized protein n=1 Tax=Paragonimus westermani TaxID=34504 RepID=A0A8T0DT17_9TREM|nr:hypothetical protein P879_01168 [Paragonimus westermani]
MIITEVVDSCVNPVSSQPHQTRLSDFG